MKYLPIIFILVIFSVGGAFFTCARYVTEPNLLQAADLAIKAADWKKKRKITISVTGLTNFPLVLKLDKNSVEYDIMKNDGTDIRFTSGDGKTILSHHIYRWDREGISYVIVQVDNTANDIYMYYGNKDAKDISSLSGRVYGDDVVCVWHFDDSGGYTVFEDGSLYNNLAEINGTPTLGQEGIFNKSALFNDGDFAKVSASTSLTKFTDQLTFSVWFKTAEPAPATRHTFMSWEFSDNQLLQAYLTNTITKVYTGVSGTNGKEAVITDVWTDQAWHHLAFTWSKPTMKTYLNGELVKEQDSEYSENLPETASFPMYIGAYNEKDGNDLQAKHWFLGYLDEMIIQKVVRDENWISAEHKNHADYANFVKIGEAEDSATADL